MEFIEELRKIINSQIRISFHFGKVTDQSGGYITVLISGSTTPVTNIRYLDSYTPTVDDIVVLVVNRGDIFALGKLADLGA